ncbi:MAG TPA: oligosaccharide flippase family protein [Gaiellales bacterium]|nr:oligosaccharide flippase family protein [Gaiellales bacterium]
MSEPAAERDADLRSVARGGTLNFIGSVLNGLLQFLLVVIVTQALTKSAAGAFFEAVALFTILSNTCELGADTGLTRMIPRYRVHGRIADVRRSMAVGIAPAFAAGLVLSIVALVAADPLAAVFTNHRDADASRVATYIRVLAVFLPVSAAYTVAVAATRGFGTMLPNAVVDRIGRAFLQLAAIGLVLAAGGGALAVGLGWGVPIAASFAVALAWLARLIAATERSPGERQPPTAMRALWTEFWRFTAPRGLTGVFQVTILWVGTLLVGSLLDAAHASVYTASTRYLVAGSIVNYAVIMAIAPKLSELLSGHEYQRAKDVYQVTTGWLMTLAWPMYITIAVFAPLLLRVFKPEYVSGASSLEVLAVAMLVATGIGPVDIVLLMGGRSFWNLFNVVVALALNVGLSLVLIPRIGIAGAACAWAAAILFNNLAPLVEVRAFLKLHPFGPGFPAVAASALVCYGALGMALRLAVGTSIPVFVAYAVLGTAAYAALMWRFRRRAELELLAGTLRAGRGRRARPVTA